MRLRDLRPALTCLRVLAVTALSLAAVGAAATLSPATADGAAAPVTLVAQALQDGWTTPWAGSAPITVDPQVLAAGDEQVDGRVSYLTFAVPALPPGASDVSVSLVLHQVSGAAGGVTAYRIVDPWAAATLTPATAPGLAGPLGYADAAGPGSTTTVLLPPSRIPFGGQASVGLTAGIGGASVVGFGSTRQQDPALWPTLSVTYVLGATPACTVSALLVPSCGAWFGSTVNPLGAEGGPADAAARLEAELGRPLDVVHVYHVAAEDWPTATEVALASDPAQPRMLMVNWKPENGSTWAQVAAGAQDALIDATAARVTARLGSTRFFLAVHHEPEDEMGPDGSGNSAADFVAMYRHVVQRLRADGVSGAVFVWDVMGYAGWGERGTYEALYPGDDVVDWIGYDPYSHQGAALPLFADRPGPTFPGFYTWATTVHPGKPLMLAEFGVAATDQADRQAVFAALAAQAPGMPAIKAYLYFDHAPDATTGGYDWSLESDPNVLAAARAAFLDPYFTHP